MTDYLNFGVGVFLIYTKADQIDYHRPAYKHVHTHTKVHRHRNM